MQGLVRSTAWLAFFAAILAAWAMMYAMATGMGLDLLGRPDAMAEAMRNMEPRMDMDMPMARFGPLFAMWAIMMLAMIALAAGSFPLTARGAVFRRTRLLPRLAAPTFPYRCISCSFAALPSRGV